MQTTKNISLEFPASRDYVPITQEFLMGTLKIANFPRKFSEKIILKSHSWFETVIYEEKSIKSIPVMFFKLSISEQQISVSIKTTDDREFFASYNVNDPHLEGK